MIGLGPCGRYRRRAAGRIHAGRRPRGAGRHLPHRAGGLAERRRVAEWHRVGRCAGRVASACKGEAPAERGHAQHVRLVEHRGAGSMGLAVVLHHRHREIQRPARQKDPGRPFGRIRGDSPGILNADVERAVHALEPPLEAGRVHHHVDGMGRAGHLRRPPAVELSLPRLVGQEVETAHGRHPHDGG